MEGSAGGFGVVGRQPQKVFNKIGNGSKEEDPYNNNNI